MPKNQNNISEDLIRKIGYDLLGPVFHRWLLALDQHVAFFDNSKTQFLFCARAGVRIQRLYQDYLQGLNREPKSNQELFWVSRLALCKGTYRRLPDRSAAIIANEYYHDTLRELVEGLFHNIPDALESPDWSGSVLNAKGQSFPEWIKSDHTVASRLRNYLKDCSIAFDDYIAKLTRDRNRVVLIDSGWQGTSQSLLHHAYHNIDWSGLYIGRILTPAHDPEIVDDVIGLLFQSEYYDSARPETAIVLYRHLFETILEPNGPSVEEILDGPWTTVANTQIAANEQDVVDPTHDRHYILIKDYLRDHAGASPAQIVRRHQIAMPELVRILLHPNSEEALACNIKERSADFGKVLKVPVLVTQPDDCSPQYRSADSRVQHSLWPQGQIALEYKGGIRQEMQNRINGLSDNKSYFDPMSVLSKGPLTDSDATLPARPLVAIITRTKNRPLLLKRAADSVARQTYENYLWVVVNDGGDEDVVREVIETSFVDRRKIRLVSNRNSLGMEAASNAGIRHVQSDYVLIHDDDDSLDPRFLEETVNHLEGPVGRRYGGVVTGTIYVSEEISGDEVIEHARVPFHGWVERIELTEMLRGNFLAPISFLYRREQYERIGGYEEDLVVLGDWFFNLEFLLGADIACLPNRALAFYHHRDFGDSSKFGVYSNSVIGGQSKHSEFIAIARNKFLRKYANENPIAVGAISGYFSQDLKDDVNGLRHEISGIKAALEAGGPAYELGNHALFAEVDRLWLLLHINWTREKKRGNRWGWRKTQLSCDQLPADTDWDTLCAAWPLDLVMPIHPTFDEDRYLAVYQDVAAAKLRGQFPSGYSHFLRYGRTEQRKRCTKTILKY